MMIGIKPKIEERAITAALVRPKVTRKIGISENDRRRKQRGEKHLVTVADEFIAPQQEAREDANDRRNEQTNGDFKKRDAR